MCHAKAIPARGSFAISKLLEGSSRDRSRSPLCRARRLLAHDFLAPVRGERGRPLARGAARASHARARRGDAGLHGGRANERDGLQPMGGSRRRCEEPARNRVTSRRARSNLPKRSRRTRKRRASSRAPRRWAFGRSSCHCSSSILATRTRSASRGQRIFGSASRSSRPAADRVRR